MVQNRTPNDLNTFAYLPNWAGQLEACAKLAQQEPWDFLEPPTTAIQSRYYILDRYLRAIFRKQASECAWEDDPVQRDKRFAMGKNHAVLNTGLLTPEYRSVYMLFEKTNGRPGILQDWMAKGFVTEGEKTLLRFDILPEKPMFAAHFAAMRYLPDLPVRLSERLFRPEYRVLFPEWLREKRVLPLYLEASLEMSRREAEQSPWIAVNQYIGGSVQIVLPLYLDDLAAPDAAVMLTAHDACYIAQTVISPRQAYCGARVIGRPEASWLRGLVGQSAEVGNPKVPESLCDRF